MAKVRDFYIGATHIEIYDDYVVRDPEKLAQINKNLSEWAYRVRLANALEEMKKAEEQAQQDRTEE